MAALLAVVEPRLAILNAEVGETRDARIIAAVVNFMMLNTMFYGCQFAELVHATCVIVEDDLRFGSAASQQKAKILQTM